MFSFRRYYQLGSTTYLELGKRVCQKVIEGDCSTHAAAMAYYFFFAIFPFFLFLATVIGYLPVPHLLEYVLAGAAKVLPREAFGMFQDNIRALFINKKQGLLSLGIFLAFWSSSSAIVSIMNAMNKLYVIKEERPFWKVRIIAILLVISLSLLFFLALVLLMFGTRIWSFINEKVYIDFVFRIIWNLMLVPVILFLLALAVAAIYYFSPDVEQKLKWIIPGSVVSIPSWMCISLVFAYYINNFSSYDRTYGSLGAVIVLLLWLYISGFIILVGAVINSVIEHSSKEGKEPGEKVDGERELPLT